MRIILLFLWLERWQWWKANDRNSSAAGTEEQLLRRVAPPQAAGPVSPVTQFEVAVEHGFTAHVVFVGDLLRRAVVVLQVGAVDGSDQRFAQVQLIDLKPGIRPG